MTKIPGDNLLAIQTEKGWKCECCPEGTEKHFEFLVGLYRHLKNKHDIYLFEYELTPMGVMKTFSTPPF